MASEVGAAYVTILPTTRGFGSNLSRSLSGDVAKTGTEQGKRFGGSMLSGLKSVALTGGAFGLAALAKSAVTTEAEFSQTMNTLAAVAKVPQRQIASLSALAIKFGQDTVFSASEAAGAMLELAKGGLTAAQIRAGALQETLTLAAASGVDMATAATIMSNAMNTFQLSAKDAPRITAALAGGANASTASIQSLGEALQQVGPGAVNAGLSVQETVAALSAFDNAGIKGSDAGTSLKTMLARLVPPTKKAQKAADALGLSFTDASGQFVPLEEIAGRLKRAFSGLSQEQRTTRLNSIFGSDASRAASVLANEGVSGIRGYLKATNDLNAAQEVAAARMSGTAGAIEQLRGAIDTAKLKIGTFIQPAVIRAADELTRAINGQSPAVNTLVTALKPAGQILQAVFSVVRGLPGPLVAAGIAMAVMSRVTSAAAPKLASFATNIRNARQGAGLLRTGLGGITGLFGGPWGLALAGGAAVLGSFAAKQAAAKARVQELTGTLNEQTGAVTNNTRALVVHNLEQSGVLAQARKLGISLRDVTAAALGNASAQARVNAVVDAYRKSLPQASGLTGARTGANQRLTASQRDLLHATTVVTGAITVQTDALRKARAAALRTAEAMGTLSAARQKAIAGLTSDIKRTGAKGSVALGTARKLTTLSRTGQAFGAADTGLSVIVYNPTPERTSESVDKALRRKRHAAGWSAG